jgi:hypothetical protein
MFGTKGHGVSFVGGLADSQILTHYSKFKRLSHRSQYLKSLNHNLSNHRLEYFDHRIHPLTSTSFIIQLGIL